MANLCEKTLKACITADCNNPIFSGIDGEAYIFNKKEIASFSFETDEDQLGENGNPNIITAINMETHTVGNSQVAYTGFRVQQFGKTPYTGTMSTLVEGNVMNKFNSEVHIVVPDNSPTAAKLIDDLKDGKFVVVLKNEYDGSDKRGSYQVYGAKKGLVATAVENDKYSEDTDGGWAVTLTEEGSPVSALFLEHKDTSGDTPVVDTKEYLASLVSSCS